MMKKALLVAVMTGCLIFDIVRAEGADSADNFIARLQAVVQLQGSFKQRQFDANDALLGQSSGAFKLLRPGFFSWEITAPDSQLIVADPEYIWHHDRDLETVTRRPVTGGAQTSPLQVLGGDESVLRTRFSIEQKGENTFVLTPANDDPGFRLLTVYLDGETISAMEIRDNLNQRVEIELSGLDSNTPLSAGDFGFVPPPGADLFYYDE